MNKDNRSHFPFDFKPAQSKIVPRHQESFKTNISSSQLDQPQSFSASHISLFAQINQSTNHLKEKTISLVCMLRKYSLQHQLEQEIESYLTDVLDQMDLILVKKNHCCGVESAYEREGLAYFEHLPKPPGDDECFHVEDTYREPIKIPLQPIKELSKETTQVELNSKLQNILREFEGNTFTRTTNGQIDKPKPSAHLPMEDDENRGKIQQKAHRFSSLYIRDINRAKKGRLA